MKKLLLLRTILLSLCLPLTCLGQRNKLAAQVITPPAVKMGTLAWDPNMGAWQTVIETCTNLLSTNWMFLAVEFNDVTNAVAVPLTDPQRYYRARSE